MPSELLDTSRYYPPHIFHMFDGSRGPSTFPHLTIALVHTQSLSAPHFSVATLMRYYRRLEFGCTHPKGPSNCQHHHAKHAAPIQTHIVLALLTAHPFILFLTFSRFLSEAAVLHCRRHLAVYRRPEVRLASGSFHTCDTAHVIL